VSKIEEITKNFIETAAEAYDKARLDALIFGQGIMRVLSDGSVQHVPLEEAIGEDEPASKETP
jgi:hypothetical protein